MTPAQLFFYNLSHESPDARIPEGNFNFSDTDNSITLEEFLLSKVDCGLFDNYLQRKNLSFDLTIDNIRQQVIDYLNSEDFQRFRRND